MSQACGTMTAMPDDTQPDVPAATARLAATLTDLNQAIAAAAAAARGARDASDALVATDAWPFTPRPGQPR